MPTGSLNFLFPNNARYRLSEMSGTWLGALNLKTNKN